MNEPWAERAGGAALVPRPVPGDVIGSVDKKINTPSGCARANRCEYTAGMAARLRRAYGALAERNVINDVARVQRRRPEVLDNCRRIFRAGKTFHLGTPVVMPKRYCAP